MLRLKTGINLQYIIFTAFLGLISLSPSLNIIPKVLITTSFHDSQRLLELLLIGLVLLHTFINGTVGLVTHQRMRYAIYSLILLAITSSYLAISPRHALIEISLFAGLFYLSLFVSHLYREHTTLLLKWLVYAFWASIIFSMVSFYVGYITATIFNTPVIWPAPLKGFSNIRSFNQYQLWTLGLVTLPLLAFEFRRTSTRWWLHVGLVAWFVLLFFASSRGALLAWGVGIVVTAIVYRQTAGTFIRLQLAYITAGFISYQVLFQLIPALKKSAVVTGTVLRDSTSDRVQLWQLAINLIEHHPIFGIGAMGFAWVNAGVAHPHNSVLQLMSEWGLPAALIILSIAGYGLACWLKRFNITSLQAEAETKHNASLVVVLFFTLVTNAAYSLVDGVIVMPISQVMMFSIVGLMLGIYQHHNTPDTHRKALFSRIFAGVVLVALAWASLPEIIQGFTDTQKHFSINYPAAGPRMWLEIK
ncbi:MAG: O-antigen ligase family protein [Sulfuriferula sp.]|nr:O-antigen ligase family protein [Sulfuriferula sp.]